jgi:hypothetical protein
MTARFLPSLTVAEYHHAEGPPRLSQSIAKELVERSPWHAKRAMDRRAPQHEDEGGESDEDKKRDTMDRGTIIHALLLNTPSPAVIVADEKGVPFDDFRTKAAKEQKAKIRAKGKIPVIARKVEPVLRLADRIREGLFIEHGIDLTGDSELAVEWTERATDGTPVPCRGMLDHWIAQQTRGHWYTIYDVKIWQSANPRVLVRKVHDMGVDIQAEAYTRAVEAVHPELAGRVRFVTLVCEVSTGLVTPIVFGGQMRKVGELRWQRAVDMWAACSARNDWPGYTRGEMVIDAPEWMIAAEIDSEHKSNDLAKYVEPAGARGIRPPHNTDDGYDDEGEDET